MVVQQVKFFVLQRVVLGDFELLLNGFGWPDSGLMWGMFHSALIGVFNNGRISDPYLDQVLGDMRNAPNAEINQELADEAQRYIVEQAFIVPLYTPEYFSLLSKRLQGAFFSEHTGFEFLDAYIETE